MSLTIENVVICRIYTVQTISLFRMSVALTKYFFQVPHVQVELLIALGIIRNVQSKLGELVQYVNATKPPARRTLLPRNVKHLLVSCTKSTWTWIWDWAFKRRDNSNSRSTRLYLIGEPLVALQNLKFTTLVNYFVFVVCNITFHTPGFQSDVLTTFHKEFWNKW